MSTRTRTYYCSCSTCTQIRNEQPKHYRYINSLRYFLTCSSCLPKRKIIRSSSNDSRMSTISFRDIDITNKHCSKHDVLIKASRPNFSRIKNEELRQRVKDANQRWTRMSILPSNLTDFIFKNKDFIPLCSICYENLSLSTFNLCHRCITTLIHYQQQTNTLQSMINNARNTLAIIPNATVLNYNGELEQFFIDYIQDESYLP